MATSLTYVNHYPVRNQAYRLYFCTVNIGSSSTFISIGTNTISVSKDGSALVTATNAGVGLDTGLLYVDLTATEMDADIVCVIFNGDLNRNDQTFIIKTIPGELTSIPTSTSDLFSRIVAIFQYLIFKRTVTSSQEKMIKADGSTVLGTGTLSDDGTTFTKGNIS